MVLLSELVGDDFDSMSDDSAEIQDTSSLIEQREGRNTNRFLSNGGPGQYARDIPPSTHDGADAGEHLITTEALVEPFPSTTHNPEEKEEEDFNAVMDRDQAVLFDRTESEFRDKSPAKNNKSKSPSPSRQTNSHKNGDSGFESLPGNGTTHGDIHDTTNVAESQNLLHLEM